MAVTDKQLALLKNRLQMPLIVRELLSAEKTPSDGEIFAMHDLLCEFSAEDSLLCAAFVMKEIAALGNVHPNDMSFFHMECERLIERYSARDDLAQENPELWDASQIDMFDSIAEDLECFMDLLMLCKLSYEITAPTVALITEILDVQLQTKLMAIDEVMSMHQAKALKQVNKSPTTTIKTNTKTIIAAQFGAHGNNIIPFPGKHIHH